MTSEGAEVMTSEEEKREAERDAAIQAALITEARLRGITPEQLLEELTDGLDEEENLDN